MKLRLWSRLRLAPRIAIMIVLTMVATYSLDNLLRRLVPPPDFVFLDRDWLREATIEAASIALTSTGERRVEALSSLSSETWLDFSIKPRLPALLRNDPPELLAALTAQIAQRLEISPMRVRATGAQLHGSRNREPETVAVIFAEKLPVLMIEMMRDSIRQDVMAASGLCIAIQLDAANWLVVTPQKGELAGARRLRNLSVVIGALALIVGLSLGIARRLTRPLTQLATAAERLGREREPTPIAEVDVPEFAAIARKFNEMQLRLKHFVDERTQMLAAISHDLRTPLTRLRLFAEYVDDGHQRQQLLSDIAEMDTIIGSSLAFASDEAHLEPHGAVDLASLLISLCDTMSDAGGRVTYHGPDHAQLPCQPVAMRRAFANLIDNGCKYGERVDVTLRDAADAIVASVTDNGPGIPQDQVERAFAPFQRLEASRNRATGGTGLGLTIARDVIGGHGGSITLTPATPTGLTVLVRLPKPG